jgi:hypothetical protein
MFIRIKHTGIKEELGVNCVMGGGPSPPLAAILPLPPARDWPVEVFPGGKVVAKLSRQV